jgi:uncharacterized protein
MKGVVLLVLLATLFWFLIFSPWTYGKLNFWGEMLAATGILAISALYLDRQSLSSVYSFRPSYILVGIGSALILYLVFLLGNMISRSLFDFAQNQVSNIYLSRQQAPPALIGVFLLAWIGPADEIFWRGFVQRRLFQKIGLGFGYLLTSLLYALIHIWAFNFMLFGAALVCGLFWGFLFLNYRSVWPGLISHAVWDTAVFVLFPIQ